MHIHRTGARALALRAALYALGYAAVAAIPATLAGDAGFFAPIGVYAIWLFPGYILAAAAHPAKAWPFHLAAGFLYALGCLALVGLPAMVLHLPFDAAFRAAIAVWALELVLAGAWFIGLGPARVRDDSRPVVAPSLDPRWFCGLAVLAALPALRGDVWQEGKIVAVFLGAAALLPYLLRDRSPKLAATGVPRVSSSRPLEAIFLLAIVGLLVVERPHFWSYCSPGSDNFHYAVLAQGMMGSEAINASDVLSGSGAPIPARFLLNLIGFLVALVGHACGLHAAPVLLTDLPVIASVLLPCAGFALSDAVLGGRRWGFAGGALSVLPYALLSGERGLYQATDLLYHLMHRASEDKSLLVFVALPTAVACAIELWRGWSWGRWGLFLAACLGLLALHPFAIPFLLFHLVLWGAVAARPRPVRALLVLGFPFALCGVVFWLRRRYATSLAEIETLPIAQLASGSGLGVHARASYLAAPFYLLVLPPLAWLAARWRRALPHERYLAVATLAPVLLAFVPPLPWLVTRVVPGGILYRVLWLLPAVPATLYAVALVARAVPRAIMSPAGAMAGASIAFFAMTVPGFEATLRIAPPHAAAVTHDFPDKEVLSTARWAAGRLEARGGAVLFGPAPFNNALVLLRPGTPLFNVRTSFFFLESFTAAGRRGEGEARLALCERAFSGQEPEEQLPADLARFHVGMVVLREEADARLRSTLLGRLGWTVAHDEPGAEGWEALEPPAGGPGAQGNAYGDR